jgi:hypothetical protein
VNIENPLAFSFIMQDDLYLLNNDKITNTATAHPETVTTPVFETPAPAFNYLGQHKKKFLIITWYPGLEFINAAHLAALESTLNRLKFGLEDVAIFNLANYAGTTFEKLADFFKPQLLLVLGRQAMPGGIETVEFNKTAKTNNCDALFTFSFDEMMNSNENKKAFWEQMKQL